MIILDIKIVEVTTKRDLDSLYDDWALTLEGLDLASIPEFVNWVMQYTTFKSATVRVYVTRGATMNKYYGLRGNNRYPDDLNIVSIKNSSMVNINAVAIPRFQVGGRWFTDIVDNNAVRNN